MGPRVVIMVRVAVTSIRTPAEQLERAVTSQRTTQSKPSSESVAGSVCLRAVLNPTRRHIATRRLT